MSRVSMFSSPLLLGFDQFERTLDRLAKNAEGYPPYNIERIGENGLRITLAVAGFTTDELAIELVENPEYYHSYAQLMLKLGDKQKALDIEQKAYELALKEKIDTQKFTSALEKMK